MGQQQKGLNTKPMERGGLSILIDMLYADSQLDIISI